MRQIALDTETTGLDPDTDRIVSLALIEMRNGFPTGEFMHFHVNPERESHPKALAVHGLTTEFLKTKPKFAQVAASARAFIGSAELIAHNASFDVAFFNAEFKRAGRKPLTNKVTCTVQLSRKQPRGDALRHTLDLCAERYRLPDLRAGRGHDALVDTLLAVLLYYRLRYGKLDEAILATVDDIMREGYGDPVREDSSSASVPEAPAPVAPAISPDVRAVIGGDGEVFLGAAKIHNASETGGAKPAEPARGTTPSDSGGRRITAESCDYISAAAALLRKALLG